MATVVETAATTVAMTSTVAWCGRSAEPGPTGVARTAAITGVDAAAAVRVGTVSIGTDLSYHSPQLAVLQVPHRLLRQL